MARNEIYTLSCEDAIAFVYEAAWGFAEVDVNGCFIWVNRAYCEILNAPAELILNTHYVKWTHPDDMQIDVDLAEKVKLGEIPGYTLSKRYIQRGSTPQRQLVVWGLLSVCGKWTNGNFAGYRVQFRVYESKQESLNLRDLSKVARKGFECIRTNWKTALTVLAIVMSLTLGGSEKLLDIVKRALEAKQSVDSLSESLSPGASPPQSLP